MEKTEREKQLLKELIELIKGRIEIYRKYPVLYILTYRPAQGPKDLVTEISFTRPCICESCTDVVINKIELSDETNIEMLLEQIAYKDRYDENVIKDLKNRISQQDKMIYFYSKPRMFWKKYEGEWQ